MRKYTVTYSIKVVISSDAVEQTIEILASDDRDAVSKAMTQVRLKHMDYYQILPISVFTNDMRH